MPNLFDYEPGDTRWLEMPVCLFFVLVALVGDLDCAGGLVSLYWFGWACVRIRRSRRTGNAILAPPPWARPFGLRRLGFVILTVLLIPFALFWLGVQMNRRLGLGFL